jgi:mono/diheme cytochrome c family protein
MADRLKACTACHGPQGRAGPDGYYPRIAGKPAGYLFNQLTHFRDGRRSAPTMAWMVDGLSDDYLREMAAHFSAQHPPYPPPPAAAADARTLERGRLLVKVGDPGRRLPACAQCHGEALMGVEPDVPALLGLPRDYLNAQFGAWRNGTRRAHAPDCMGEVARRMAPEDIASVTAWLALQPVPSQARAQAPQPDMPRPLSCGGPALSASQRQEQTVVPDARSKDPAARGAYLAQAGHCAGCHTVRGGEPYAGGRAIATPFGEVYATNLTPDPGTGIGAWSAGDFWRAMHEGRSRDGRALNPAFPYTEFTRLTRADSDALFAWLRTLAPVKQANREHALRFPFNMPLAVEAWRLVYFRAKTFAPDPSRDATWNRGAYLVQGLGHCGACHTARNALGASTGEPFGGADLPGLGWHAPSLTRGDAGGVGAWPLDRTVAWLAGGRTEQAVATGPMARVVSGSLQHLDPADLQAMATYLQSLQTAAKTPAASTTRNTVSRIDATYLAQGEQLYGRHCADCHGRDGEGVSSRGIALAGNRTLMQSSPTNTLRVVLHGGFSPDTRHAPRPPGMPPFAQQLTDREVGAVVSYVRNAWGHRASGVEVRAVNVLRPIPVE